MVLRQLKITKIRTNSFFPQTKSVFHVKYLTGIEAVEHPEPSTWRSLTRCRPCETPPDSETEETTGRAEPAGVRPGPGPPGVPRAGRRRPGAAGARGSGRTGSGSGQSTCRSSARTPADCRRPCWRPASPAGGRRPAPRSSSSWWTGGPCLCCCGGKGNCQGFGFTLVPLRGCDGTPKPTERM